MNMAITAAILASAALRKTPVFSNPSEPRGNIMKKLIAKVAAIGLVAIAAPVFAQDALFVDSTGNVGVGTNMPGAQMHVSRSDGTAQILVQETNSTESLRSLFQLENNGDPAFRFVDTSSGAIVDFRLLGLNDDFAISHSGTGGVELRLGSNGNMTIAGTLIENSDRAAKEAIREIDSEWLLSTLAELPVTHWQYKKAPDSRHIGPMAQDFHALFGYGTDETKISPRDMAGVALAASKVLLEKMDTQHQLIAQQTREIEALKARNQQLATQVTAVEALTAQMHVLEARFGADEVALK